MLQIKKLCVTSPPQMVIIVYDREMIDLVDDNQKHVSKRK